MKWIAFTGMVMFGVPVMTWAALHMSRARTALFALLVFSTVIKVSVNFWSLEDYRGPDRGFEVHLTDLVALSLGLSMLVRRPGQLTWLPFNSLFLALLIGLAAASTITAPSLLLASFTLWKWGKSCLLYWVAYNFMRREYPIDGLWLGCVGLAGVLTLQVLRQKYLMGLYRPMGTFDHSNTIPCYLLMVIPLMLAWLSDGKRLSRWRTLASLGAILGMSACVVATVSRAGIALLGIALIAVMTRSMLQGISTRKVGMSVLFLIAMAAGLAKCADTLIERILYAPKSSAEARDEFNHAADMMAAQNLLGVGLNCFSEVMTSSDQYREHVKVMGNEEHAGVCHHIYRLNAAELGYIGLLAHVLVIGRFYVRQFWWSLGRESLDRSLLSGLVIGFTCVHLIGFLEWVFRLTPVLNLFLILSAVGIGLAERLAAQARLRTAGAAPGSAAASPLPVLPASPRPARPMIT